MWKDSLIKTLIIISCLLYLLYFSIIYSQKKTSLSHNESNDCYFSIKLSLRRDYIFNKIVNRYPKLKKGNNFNSQTFLLAKLQSKIRESTNHSGKHFPTTCLHYLGVCCFLINTQKPLVITKYKEIKIKKIQCR